jgi:hypothetical protein
MPGRCGGAAYWPDGTSNGEGPAMRHLGWRGDCIGDMGFRRAEQGDWCHMYAPPYQVVRTGYCAMSLSGVTIVRLSEIAWQMSILSKGS